MAPPRWRPRRARPRETALPCPPTWGRHCDLKWLVGVNGTYVLKLPDLVANGAPTLAATPGAPARNSITLSANVGAPLRSEMAGGRQWHVCAEAARPGRQWRPHAGGHAGRAREKQHYPVRQRGGAIAI